MMPQVVETYSEQAQGQKIELFRLFFLIERSKSLGGFMPESVLE